HVERGEVLVGCARCLDGRGAVVGERRVAGVRRVRRVDGDAIGRACAVVSLALEQEASALGRCEGFGHRRAPGFAEIARNVEKWCLTPTRRGPRRTGSSRMPRCPTGTSSTRRSTRGAATSDRAGGGRRCARCPTGPC